MTSEYKTRIQLRRDTSANWTSCDPVLLDGERIVVVTDAGETRYKTGDGTKKYTQLPFDDEVVRNLVNNKVDMDAVRNTNLLTDNEPTSQSTDDTWLQILS